MIQETTRPRTNQHEASLSGPEMKGESMRHKGKKKFVSPGWVNSLDLLNHKPTPSRSKPEQPEVATYMRSRANEQSRELFPV